MLELLREQEQLRRGEIMEAAKQAGLTVSETVYGRVVKELCQSKGSVWTIKGSV